MRSGTIFQASTIFVVRLSYVTTSSNVKTMLLWSYNVRHGRQGIFLKSWIGHFVKNINNCGLEITSSYRHLYILDGHGSQVIVDVIKTARIVGLDFLILPSHTSYAM